MKPWVWSQTLSLGDLTQSQPGFLMLKLPLRNRLEKLNCLEKFQVAKESLVFVRLSHYWHVNYVWWRCVFGVFFMCSFANDVSMWLVELFVNSVDMFLASRIRPHLEDWFAIGKNGSCGDYGTRISSRIVWANLETMSKTNILSNLGMPGFFGAKWYFPVPWWLFQYHL